MRNHNLDAGSEVRGGAAAVEGRRRKRRTRRSWSVEEKIRIVRESLASAETITAVVERHGIPRNRLSSWRTQLRRGQLVALSLALEQSDVGFAAAEVEAAPSAVIEGRGVTVRLEGSPTGQGSRRLRWRWQATGDGVIGRPTDFGVERTGGYSQGP